MRRAVLLGPLLAMAQFSCANDPLSEPVAPHRTKWQEAGISDYEFSIVHFGAVQSAPPMRVLVRDGKVQSATLSCLPSQSADNCNALEQAWLARRGGGALVDHAKTIPQIFDEIISVRAAASKQKARIQVTFDSTFGYPTRFNFDDPTGDDDEFGFQISEFKVTE